MEADSAAEIWDRHASAALIPVPGEVTPDSVAEELRSWQPSGYRVLSILDDDYPARLRGETLLPIGSRMEKAVRGWKSF